MKKGSTIPRNFFLVYCLALTGLWALGYSAFVSYFQSGYEVKHQVKVLKKQIQQTEFQKRILQGQLLDLQQTVAEVLPDERVLIAKKWDDRVIDLSTQLRRPASMKPLDLSNFYFEKGKKLFALGKYKSALKEFEKLNEEFPTSDRGIEGTFLILESAFRQKDFKKAVDTAELMVSQFPNSIYTGYALIRLGQISEINNQFEEATALYRIVKDNFKDKNLQAQAVTLERRIGNE